MQVPTQKISKKESKMDQNSNTGPAPKRAIWHFWSADWHKLGPWPKGTWIKLKYILFDFLEIRMRPNLYSNHLAKFLNTPTSINRGCISEFNTLFHALRFPLFLTLLSIILTLTLKKFYRL